MALAYPFESANNYSNTSSQYIDESFTVPSGTTLLVAVICIGRNANAYDPTPDAVIWDSGGTNQAMTARKVQLSNGNANRSYCVGIYTLKNPTAGTKTFRIDKPVTQNHYSSMTLYYVTGEGATYLGSTDGTNKNSVDANIYFSTTNSTAGSVIFGGVAAWTIETTPVELTQYSPTDNDHDWTFPADWSPSFGKAHIECATIAARNFGYTSDLSARAAIGTLEILALASSESISSIYMHYARMNNKGF